MSNKLKPYICSKVPNNMCVGQNDLYYCHKRDYPNIPVFGSIGSYQKAKKVCNIYNKSLGR